MDVALRKLQQLVKDEGSQRAAAKRLGVSAPMLNDLLFGRRNFSDRLLARLGLKRIETIQEAK